MSDAEFNDDGVTVAYDKATVKDAPKIAEDGHLSRRRSSSSTATTASVATTTNLAALMSGPADGRDRPPARDAAATVRPTAALGYP